MHQNIVRIAIPLSGGKLSQHFGHSEQFGIFEVNKETNAIAHSEVLTPPPHKPGAIPRWLKEQNAGVVICGGIGEKAQMIFKKSNIELVMCSSNDAPEEIVSGYLNNTLTKADHACQHHQHRGCQGHS